jgi:hypothetical protein
LEIHRELWGAAWNWFEVVRSWGAGWGLSLIENLDKSFVWSPAFHVIRKISFAGKSRGLIANLNFAMKIRWKLQKAE